MKIICVAEKPSLSKSITAILSGGSFQSESTGNKYIKNYKFNTMYDHRQCDVTMTAMLGHLMELEFGPELSQWNQMTIPKLFKAKVIKRVKPDLSKLESNLKQLARSADMLVIWTDCDREGENIGAEVALVCQSVNSRLKIKRAQFSVVQHREIMSAWNNLRDLDWYAVAAVDARSELDLRIGAAFTRYQTINLKPRFAELKDQKVLSYGPCQFPTLGFVVDRFLRARDFREEDFWYLNCCCTKDGIESQFKWQRGHLFDHQATLALYEVCLENPRAVVTKAEGKPTSKWPPLPLTTVDLQKFGSSYLKISSDKIMIVAEALYNKGIISYPRTETDCFDNNFQLKPLIEKQVEDANWGNYATELLQGKFKFPRKGKKNDQAHPPIHPVRAAHNLEGDERKVFEFITRRFLACCSEAAKGHLTSVSINIAGETFNSSGLTVLEKNYLEVYTYDSWSDSKIGKYAQGEQLSPTLLNLAEGSTTRPNMLTEAELIGLMDSSGIGTDATIHEHIKKILDRDYANKEGNYFFPTTLGMALVAGYEDMDFGFSFSRPELRASMERNMGLICEGKKTKEEVIQEVIDIYSKAYEVVAAKIDVFVHCFSEYMTQVSSEEIYQEFIRFCPTCSSEMLLRRTRTNRFIVSCSGYPNCRECVWIPELITNCKSLEQCCEVCSEQEKPVKKVRLEFNLGDFPGKSSPCDTCLWCNMDDFRCFLSSSNGPPQPPNTNNSHNSRGNDNYGSHYNSGNNEEGKLNRDNSNLDSPYQSKGSLSDKLKCHCQIPAIRRKVLKPGNNCGRDFFVCSKMQNDPKKCDYYKWADEIDGNDDFHSSNNTQRRKEIPKTSQRKCKEDAPNCECGIAGVSRTVKKEGPNCGKEFYVCSKGSTDTSRCNFFTWATAAGDLVANFKEYEAASSSVSDKNEAKCNCGLFAVKKTAKTGANPNKEFYTCAKSAGKCKYFQWVTDGDDLQGQSNFHDRGTKYESQYSSNTGKGNTNDTRTCYKCDKIGHFASNCPEGQSSSKSGFACYKCGESGHMAPNCPLAPSDGRNGQSSNASGFTCFKCGEPDHLAPDCGQGPSKGKGGKRGAGGSTRGNTKKSNTKKGGKKANQRQSSMKL